MRLGSRWEIHARFPVSQKDACIEEAHEIERSMGAMVKVSRETFDSDSGVYKEIVVYRTPGSNTAMAAKPPVSRGGGRGGGGSGWGGGRSGHSDDDDDDDFAIDGDGFFKRKSDDDDDDDDEKPRRKPKRKAKAGEGGGSAGNLILRVLLVTLLSFVVSGGVTWALSGSQQRLEALRRTLGFEAHTDVLVTIFMGLFILSFLALAVVLLSDYLTLGPRVPAAAPAPKPPPAKGGGADAMLKERAAGKWLEDRRAEGVERLPETEIPDEETHWEPAPPVEEVPPEPPLPPPQEDPPSEVPVEEVPASGMSEAAEGQRALMSSFMEMALRDLTQALPRVDSFNRFGVSLFVAGAVESLANDKSLPREETALLLRTAVESLGTPSDQATKFAESYESYLLNARYMEMFEHGRLAVNCFLEGDSEGSHRLGPALQGWNKPKKEDQSQSGTVAVMFTDMVGSTDLNQTVGDARAQHVVHTHNRIVRGVLADYYGKEVKHTGDGIMAAFSNTSNAVKAGLVIMKRVAANNRAEKDLPLTLRIGLNVGEPIQENNDLFGVTVQMAARLCAAAQPNQVIVSEAVKAMCAGKDIKFVDHGTRLLKGIPEPVHVFEPAWEPAPPPPPPPTAATAAPQAPAKG
ncbi:MAG: adenylate/guanylate cyclase domain-containing protein [Magnetospirillum sp. WYHS-4]